MSFRRIALASEYTSRCTLYYACQLETKIKMISILLWHLTYKNDQSLSTWQMFRFTVDGLFGILIVD